MATKTKKTERECYVGYVNKVEYQRNGISGTGFSQVYFRMRNDDGTNGLHLIGVVFPLEKSCAVINPLDASDHYRGDCFEVDLRTAITKDRLEQFGTHCYGCDSDDALQVAEKTGRQICKNCGRSEDEE